MPLPALQSRASGVTGFGRTLLGAFVALYLFGSLLLINLLQTLSLVVRPFSRTAFRRVNRWFADRFWSWCAWTTLSLHRTRAVMTGDALPSNENALVIVNHQTMTDVQVLFLLTINASPGHLLLGMRVVPIAGGYLGLWRPFARTLLLCLVIPALIWDLDQRGMHDRLVGTVLVRR